MKKIDFPRLFESIIVTAVILFAIVFFTGCVTEPLLPMCDEFEPAYIDESYGLEPLGYPDGTWWVWQLFELDTRGPVPYEGKRFRNSLILDPRVQCSPEPHRVPSRLLPRAEQ